MRIFVAGATGVLGRRAVALLLGAGHRVTGVARSSERAQLLRDLGAEPLSLDVFDEAETMKAAAGHDVVCNLATHIPPSARFAMPKAWAENDRVRTEASRNLVNAAMAAGARRFIQESIGFLYKDGGSDPIDESSPLEPVGLLHSATVAEGNARRFSESGGAGVVLRFAQFYGHDSETTIATIRLAKRGIAMSAAPEAYMSSINTDDAASAVLKALDAPAGIYNVADDEPMTRREHFETLATALGVKAPRIAPAWLAKLGGTRSTIMLRSQRLSNALVKEKTGWTPRYPSVREGWPAVVSRVQDRSS